MASGLQNILRSLVESQQERTQRMKDEREFKEQQRQFTEQQNLRSEQLKEQKRQFDEQQKALKLAQDLASFGLQGDVIQKAAQGVQFPGAKQTPIGGGTRNVMSQPGPGGVVSTGTPMFRTETTEPTEIEHEIRIPGQDEPIKFKTPTPERYHEQQAKYADIGKKSEREFELEKEGLKKEADYIRNLLTQMTSLQRTRESTEAANVRSQRQIDAADRRNQAIINSRFKLAEMKSKGEVLEDIPVETILDDIQNGRISDKAIKLRYGTKTGTALMNEATKANIGIVNDDQRQALSNYQKFGSTIKQMDEFLEKSPDLEIPQLGAAGRIIQTEASRLENQLQGDAGNIAKDVQGQSGRLSDKDVVIAMRSALPSLTRKKSGNISQRNDFYNKMKSSFYADLNTLPKEQVDSLWEGYMGGISPTYESKTAKDKKQSTAGKVIGTGENKPSALGKGRKVTILAPTGESNDFNEGDWRITEYLKRPGYKIVNAAK